MNRAEKVAEAQRLREAGLVYREIADRLGVSVSYAQVLVKDPDDTEAKARKRKAGGTCVDCGAATTYKTGAPATRCATCATAHQKATAIWTREAIIDCIRAWVDVYGTPPGARDWSPQMARLTGRDDIAIRFYDDGCWPNLSSVQHVFGTWNAAIEAAGFTPRKPGSRGPGTPPVVAKACA